MVPMNPQIGTLWEHPCYDPMRSKDVFCVAHIRMSWQQDTRRTFLEVLTLVAVASSGQSLWIWCRIPLFLQGQGVEFFCSPMKDMRSLLLEPNAISWTSLTAACSLGAAWSLFIWGRSWLRFRKEMQWNECPHFMFLVNCSLVSFLFPAQKCKRPDKSKGSSLLDSPLHFFNVAHVCIFSQDDFFLW